MNKKFFFSCFVCILIFIFSITFYFNKQTIIKSENRYVTTFPELPQKISSSIIKKYFIQLSQFYTDNFPNREKIILTLTTLIPSIKKENFSYDTVVVGKNDWLFIGNKNSRTIEKLTGKLYYHDSHSKNYNTITRYNHYKNIADKILSQNKSLFFLVGPNKSTIYPEFLPDKLIPAPKPFHEQLLKKMQAEGLNIYYPCQDLLDAKKDAVLYYISDSHWNHYGAFIAFINLIPQLDPNLSSIIKKENFSFKKLKSHGGDLIVLGNFVFKEKDYNDNFEPLYKNAPLTIPNAKQINDAQTGLKHVINPDALIDKTVWVIGDSFSLALDTFFSFCFQNYYHIHINNFDPSSIEKYKDIQADYVIFEFVERKF